ncbi:MAG TPA: glycosyl hydrolase family 18 protein [Chloroflexota bacterium]
MIPTLLVPSAQASEEPPAAPAPAPAAAAAMPPAAPAAGGFALLPAWGNTSPGQPVAPAPVAPAAIQPAPAPQPSMLRWVYMVGSQLPDSIRQHPDSIDVLSPAWFYLDDNGNVQGQDSPEVSRFARAHGIKLMPIVTNALMFDPDVAHDILIDSHNQTRALDGLSWLVNNFGYDGINIDFENLYNSDRDLFSGFMANVYARVHRENGKMVTIALGAKTKEDNGFSAPFDYKALAPNFDLGVIMTYDDHYAGGEAGPVAPLSWDEQVINYATRFIPASKLLLGLPFYGYNWNVSTGGWARAMDYSSIVQTVFAHGVTVQMDPASQTPVVTYDSGSGVHQIWFENSTSLGYKISLAAKHGLAGWGAWRGGMEDQNFWSLDLLNAAAA